MFQTAVIYFVLLLHLLLLIIRNIFAHVCCLVQLQVVRNGQIYLNFTFYVTFCDTAEYPITDFVIDDCDF